MSPILAVPLFVVLFFLLAGVVDIARNGASPRMLTRRGREAAGAKDATGPIVVACALVAGLLVLTGAVSIVETGDGPGVRFDSAPLEALASGIGGE